MRSCAHMSLRTHVTLIISAQDVKQHALVIPVLRRARPCRPDVPVDTLPNRLDSHAQTCKHAVAGCVLPQLLPNPLCPPPLAGNLPCNSRQGATPIDWRHSGRMLIPARIEYPEVTLAPDPVSVCALSSCPLRSEPSFLRIQHAQAKSCPNQSKKPTCRRGESLDSLHTLLCLDAKMLEACAFENMGTKVQRNWVTQKRLEKDDREQKP